MKLLSLTFFVLVWHTALVTLAKDVMSSDWKKIVGGQPVKPGEIFYQVIVSSNLEDKPFCGGSLVDVNNFPIVISAAHCFEHLPNPADWQVLAGIVDYSNLQDCQERNISRIIMHQDYNTETNENDIALLFLDTPFHITNYVKPIKLPETVWDEEEELVVSGWGYVNGTGEGTLSDVLRVASLPVVKLDKCREIWAKHPVQSEIITEAMICVGGGGTKSACHGDSGSPAVNKEKTLVGIISHGEEHCNPQYPTFFTRVSHFTDWIKRNVDGFTGLQNLPGQEGYARRT